MFCHITWSKLSANDLSFHWRWRWWNQIEDVFLNLFYFTQFILLRLKRWWYILRWSHKYEFYAKLYILLSTFKGAVFSLICSLRALSTKEKRYSIHPLGPFPFYIWIKNPLEAVMAPCTVLPNKIKLVKNTLCIFMSKN